MMLEDSSVKAMIVFVLVLWYVLCSVVAFVQMGIDKRRAVKHAYRIPEKQLFLPVMLGGSLGGILGMYSFRHKTKHWYFPVGFFIALAVHIVILVLVLMC